ncbi:hypothetical protein [Pseudosulfitobacter pseudonitzschiae]|uniref:hypothetical protein n=1 Tax=Pseudosulfitobacter pseudonitzschiae TaxID=1402135 RepID=UPI003B7829B2
MNPSIAMDHLHDTVRGLLVENDGFFPQRRNGSWSNAVIPSNYPNLQGFIKGILPELIIAAERCLDEINALCRLAARENNDMNVLSDVIADTSPEDLVDEEFNHLRLKLKTISPRAYGRAIGKGDDTTTRKMDSLSFIHGALFMEAVDLCEDIRKSKAFIGHMMEDPKRYLDELHNRRWDAANLAFSETLEDGHFEKISPWRQFGETWIREFEISTDGADTGFCLASVQFRPLHSTPENIRISISHPDTDPIPALENIFS